MTIELIMNQLSTQLSSQPRTAASALPGLRQHNIERAVKPCP